MTFLLLFNISHRYHDHWRFALQKLSFLASFVIFLESGKLATRSEIAQMIGGTAIYRGHQYSLANFVLGRNLVFALPEMVELQLVIIMVVV